MNWRTNYLSALLPAFICGLALSRLLYEGFYPRLPWLGRPVGALLLAVGAAGIAWLILKRVATESLRHGGFFAVPFLPFLFNLIWLLQPTVDLVGSRLIFFISLWVGGYFGLALAFPCFLRKVWPSLAWLLLGIAPLYLGTMPAFVGRADTFEFQVVVPKLGIVHPTGYPLYLLLSKLITNLIPDWWSFAWQLNFTTMLFALGVLCFVFLIIRKIVRQEMPALVATFLFALTPTFWNQAIEAEVYALHLLIVAVMLWLLVNDEVMGGQGDKVTAECPLIPSPPHPLTLSLLLGLGMTNHVTTVFLLPPLLLTLFFLRRQYPITNYKFWLKMIAVGLLPLLLYAYLPLRWAAVNGEPMGMARFMDWVIGGRFQGALQWRAWLDDPTRYGIVGRLFLAEWGWWGLAFAFAGWLVLLGKKPRIAVVLLTAWMGFAFYSLNYYVPDLAVFLLPAQLVVAVCLGTGLRAVGDMVTRWQGDKFSLSSKQPKAARPLTLSPPHLVTVLVMGFFLPAFGQSWHGFAATNAGILTQWGQAVLQLPLAEGAAILADSEKIAPLLYLQQAEGKRPDLQIMVLPDEAAYRAELDTRVGAGQTVYLARFLPALAGEYYLRSIGPLLEVSRQPVAEMPADVTPLSLDFAGIQLRDTQLKPISPYAENEAAITLYWQKEDNPVANQVLFLRWRDGEVVDAPISAAGTHAAGNYYPVSAWRTGEIITDFHQLPYPDFDASNPLKIEAAWGLPFSDVDTLDWQEVAEMPALSPQNKASLEVPCDWFRFASHCPIVEYADLELPEDSTNFANKTALLNVEFLDHNLQPGGQLSLTLQWLALAKMEQDYTVFVQVVDENDRIVGQVDSWPLQGTFPTSQWQPGEIVDDPYVVQLDADLPAGKYCLLVGMYLLADFERLPVLDNAGIPRDDKFILPLSFDIPC